jgi:hypothetical protein
VSQRDGLLLLENILQRQKGIVQDITYGLMLLEECKTTTKRKRSRNSVWAREVFAAGTAFPFEIETMTTMYAMDRANSV